ncbi:MAG: protease inhibitor I42 family protein [Bacteroidota bacterium]
MKRILLITLLAVSLAACRGSGEPTNPLVKIETQPGKEFKLVLESNPSTGYHWEIMGDLDKSVVEFVGREYKQGESQQLGAGGVDVMTFKAVSPGETSITLGYFPPSNTATQPEKTEKFTVSVK